MALADLLVAPKTPQDMQLWALHHRVEHEKIRDRIQALTAINLPEYQIEPIYLKDPRKWLADHQQAHSDMTEITGVQSVDLETVDFSDQKQRAAWAQLHWLEHYAVNAVLKL